MKIFLYVAAGLIAYCLGSISTGILVSRFTHGPDLRTVGSGNTGATNVQRTMGWKYGLITFAGDSLKAVIACWLAQLITGSPVCARFCGLLVIIGHNWPVFFQFKGGKGVASSCGVMLFCFPLPALICFVLTIGLIAVSQYQPPDARRGEPSRNESQILIRKGGSPLVRKRSNPEFLYYRSYRSREEHACRPDSGTDRSLRTP